MKTLSTPLIAEKNASQAGWGELYDIYLKSAITTPWGSVSTLRLCTVPGGVNFFKPGIAPETDLNAAAAYSYWPLKRAVVKGDAKFTDDKLQIAASNVSGDWQGMLADVDWYDTTIIIRKISTTIATPAADDCAILWSGSVDAAKVTLREVQLECSSDLVTLGRVLPAENMHTSCRYAWADDGCTKIRFHADHYKSKTCGSSSTTTTILSSGLTEDTGASGSYGTDLVDAIADGAVTTSSEATGFSAVAVTDITPTPTGNKYTNNTMRMAGVGTLAENIPLQFAASVMPTGLTAATTYYTRDLLRLSAGYYRFRVSATPGGAAIAFTTTGTAVTATSDTSYAGYEVKASNAGLWKFSTDADWGTLSNGFYTIPDAQAGLANGALKPYIQFDFGSAKSPKVWQIETPAGLKQEELVRLILFFSSTNATDWTHEMYYELPPVSGKVCDVLIPDASSARYWRICVRSRWAEALFYTMFQHVAAFEDSRNYWLGGRVTFASNTSTVALRNVSRRVLRSYAGGVIVPALPVAPANGDTFVIERGCRRAFNDCCARYNWENFAGFTDLPYQTVIR